MIVRFAPTFPATAKWFWTRASVDRYIPCDLTLPALIAVPVSIVEISGLCIRTIDSWLSKHHVFLQCHWPNRPMRGCLVAFGGHGLIFVEKSDAADEARLTLAHELAHFLLHYYRPRLDAIAELGAGIVPVLDGHRAPTDGERLTAVLSNIHFGLYEHAMARTASGVPDADTEAIEADADLLAFELLAPMSHVMRRIKKHKNAAQLLQQEYGFPAWAAEAYGALVSAKQLSQTSRSNWFGSD